MPYVFAILVFNGIAFWIQAFNSSSETSQKLEKDAILHYCLHPADAMYHLIDSECGSESDCSIGDR